MKINYRNEKTQLWLKDKNPTIETDLRISKHIIKMFISDYLGKDVRS